MAVWRTYFQFNLTPPRLPTQIWHCYAQIVLRFPNPAMLLARVFDFGLAILVMNRWAE